MNIAAKIWDFVWGTLLVGMLPMFAFCLVGFLASLFRTDESGWIHSKYLACLFWAAAYVVPFATFYFIARGRQKHRLLPASLLVVEILLGLLLAGAAFFFTVAFWGFASLD